MTVADLIDYLKSNAEPDDIVMIRPKGSPDLLHPSICATTIYWDHLDDWCSIFYAGDCRNEKRGVVIE